MRRIIIGAIACVVAALAAAPAASAATATFSGTCAITGVSTFDPPLTGTEQIIKYDFKSGAPADGEADGTKCSGELNGKPVTDVPVQASVAGEGNLSCSHGESTTPGEGALVFPDGSTFTFGFTFTAVLTEVDFKATYGATETTGHASFLHYAPPTSGFDCSPAGSGIKALGFEATTDESSTPIQGTKPDSGSPQGGQQPTGGEQPSGTEQKPTAKQRRAACIKKAKKKKNKKKRKKAIRRCRRIK